MKTVAKHLTLLILLGCVLAACAPASPAGAVPTGASAESAAGEAPAFINIGATIPLTGSFASGGAQVQRGYQYAVDAINAAGGIYVEAYGVHIPLNLIVMDDESNPEKVVGNLETLYTNQNVTAYLGGFGSSLHSAAAAIAEKNHVPYLGIAFAQYDIHQQGYRYLFSPFWKSPQMASDVYVMLNTLLPEGSRPTKVAIIHEQTDWGIELGTMWAEAAPQYGYEVVAKETYSVGNADFTDIILRVQAAGAEAVLTLPIPPDGYTLVRQMAELGYTPDFLLVVRAPDNTPVWVENLGSAGDYVVIAPGWHNSLTYAGVDAINARHMDEFGVPALAQVGNAYAVIQVLADAIERAGTLEREAVRDAIAATDLETVVGHVVFNEDGTSNVSNPMVQIVGGAQQLIWPLEFATAELVYPAPAFDDR
ncbi:MAG TPA: amino acid ABC transporter substrate-binding protein [Anaerolineales bacterium]|nr:amino acid ABC transporter substrate-binding protein [Anaerolineales bacterium]HRQ91782.1 amino acid ABC transporter substrate-binding protein [Anaerolineales bacterium]